MEWSICTDKGIYTFIRDEALKVPLSTRLLSFDGCCKPICMSIINGNKHNKQLTFIVLS